MQPVIYESEYNFCKILWENEPVKSTELVKLCKEKLEWKKSTTYTVIKRLSEREIIKSENAIVTSLVKKEIQCNTAKYWILWRELPMIMGMLRLRGSFFKER